MSEKDPDVHENWFKQIGIFPLLIGVLGGAALIAGITIPVLYFFEPEIQEKIFVAQDSSIMPVVLMAIGFLLLSLFFLLKEIRGLERKMAALTEHAFDREVAALLAALRPFAERLEERIGPVLTASQKLSKPLDTLAVDVQGQAQKIYEMHSGFEEVKLLVGRIREDFVQMGRGRSLDPIQKQIEELGSALQAKLASPLSIEPIEKQIQEIKVALQQNKPEPPNLEPLRKSLEDSFARLQEKQNELASSVSVAREGGSGKENLLAAEIAKGVAVAEKSLHAAQEAAASAKAAAETAGRAVAMAEQIEAALRDRPAVEAAPSASRKEETPPAPPKPEPEPTSRKESEPVTPSPQEKRSIRDAIAKLKQLRGGN